MRRPGALCRTNRLHRGHRRGLGTRVEGRDDPQAACLDLLIGVAEGAQICLDRLEEIADLPRGGWCWWLDDLGEGGPIQLLRGDPATWAIESMT